MPNVGDIIRAADFSGAGIKAGAVVPFYNVTLSGRYPIFWGESEADTSWLVCDGGSDLHGGNVPNLSNRFIMGVTSVSAAKKTGGSTTTSSSTIGGNVGSTTLTTSTMLMPRLPVYARLDGRAFHTFCRGLDKPFDMEFVGVMREVCKSLVKQTNAKLGYVQSDEISLAWEDPSKAPFDGRLFKLTSVLASMATTSFVLNCVNFPKLKDKVEKLLPNFDCRVFQLPNMTELANAFVWRENDAARNAVSMVAQANFSHKELQGKSTSEMNEMLFTEKGINFNDIKPYLKRGSYFQRVNVMKVLDDETLSKIPVEKIPENNMVMRTEVRELQLPIMKKVENKVETYFYNAEPIMYGDD